MDGREHLVHAGESLVMPAEKPHAVSAPEAFGCGVNDPPLSIGLSRYEQKAA